MSGEKRSPIQILRDDLSSMQRQVTNMNRINSNLQQALSSASRQRAQDQRAFQQTLQAREASFSRSVNGLQSNMRSMETRHLDAMRRQNNEFGQRLQEQSLAQQSQLLREKQERVAAMQLQKRELEQQITQEIGQERAERQRQIQRLEREIATIDAELRTEIARVEQEFDQKLDLERVQRQRALNNLREWTSGMLERQREEYLSIAEAHEQEMVAIRDDMNQVFAKEAFNQQTARAFIEDLERQIQEANEHLPHRKFTPGQLEKIRRNTTDAKMEVSQREQAAMAGAKAAYFDLVDLREEIIRKEQEFNLWHQATLEMARSLFENVRANREVSLEQSEELVEVDFWTNGRFSALEEQIKVIKDELEHGREDYSLEEVKQRMEELKTLAEEEQALIKEAVERVISSQLRAEMADVVVEALQKEGFTMLESGYEKEDQRKVYLVKVANNAGTEIVAAVVPNDETNTNTLSINTRDERFFREELTQARFEDIKRLLQESGLHVGKTECFNEHIQGLYDVENILKRGGQGIPKAVLEKARMLNGQTG